jgi:hypothetical protein
MRDWNGKEIESAISGGGVRVVAHPFDNLISTGCSPWPPPEVLQKLYQSRQVRAFDGDQLEICRSGIGYYTDLQSLHSEDAITWSVFGIAARAQQRQLQLWLADLFRLLDISEASPEQAEVFLWRRIPHPDTLVSGGPEIDAGIVTENALVFCEAKWQSKVDTAQGKKRDKDQIQLRGEFLKKFGERLFPRASVLAVAGVSLLPDSFTNTAPPDVLFRCATWEAVCSLPSHPHADEVRRYYQWKKENTRVATKQAELTR